MTSRFRRYATIAACGARLLGFIAALLIVRHPKGFHPIVPKAGTPAPIPAAPPQFRTSTQPLMRKKTAADATGRTYVITLRMRGDTTRIEPATLTAAAGDLVIFRPDTKGPFAIKFDTAGLSMAARRQLDANMPSTTSPLMSPALVAAGDAYPVSLGRLPAGRYGFRVNGNTLGAIVLP